MNPRYRPAAPLADLALWAVLRASARFSPWWAPACRTRRSPGACTWWEGTVKTYVSAVLDRLEVKNRVQAAIVAYEAGLLT